MDFIIIKIRTINMAIAKPPQSGAVTHHQDQSIYPVNFRVMKIKNMNPKNPIPPEDLFSDILISVY